MKLITALIRPTALKRVAAALRKARVNGITVTKVEGFGKEHLSADVDLFGHLNPKAKVEVAVDDDILDDVMSLLKASVNAEDRDRGGTIFVQDLEDLQKISF